MKETQGEIMKTVVMKVTLILLALAVCLCTIAMNVNAAEKKASISKVWESKKEFLVPESVLYNKADKILYISNINGNPTEKNGKGFISKLSLEGKILKLKWAEGLNAPKGSAIYKNSFFVSDIDRLVEINMETGKIKNTFPAKGALFLNDVAVDDKGNVYVTEMDENNSAIYKLTGGKLEVWVKGS
jgi:sugar lactone lactonase YvrE